MVRLEIESASGVQEDALLDVPLVDLRDPGSNETSVWFGWLWTQSNMFGFLKWVFDASVIIILVVL
jgi:hypothetical protein